MGYRTLESCLSDLEKNGQLVRIKEETDPFLQMAAIHLRVHEAGGPALLFENVKGSRFRSASNVFGTLERSRFIFRDKIEQVQQLLELRNNPLKAIRHPVKNFNAGLGALHAFPLKNPFSRPVLQQRLSITDMPLIHHWPKDGGAFITLPQVYTEDADKPGIMNANLGMYRIQLTGNDYNINKEAGLHYQLHRGIGIHQAKTNKKNIPLKVSVFVGGPPAHTLAAVMPLPEGISEMTFAGVLGGRRFRYVYKDNFCISTDADFVITGEVFPGENKPEGPFGDHLGYYSLQHLFPLMKIRQVFAKKNAIWPFTVVGRPPQEDTAFGHLIHLITGNALKEEIPGLKEVNAVDAAGVHPLLLATGSERYTPYTPVKQPAELLTIANHILGTGQLSLAKFLFITADDDNKISAQNIPAFFRFILQRLRPERDIHFYTNTTIDTLDYSGNGLNSGSKVVIAAYGDIIRNPATEIPECLKALRSFGHPVIALPGIIILKGPIFTTYKKAGEEFNELDEQLRSQTGILANLPVLVIADDPVFTGSTLNNFLWVTFTRCNPSHDIRGVDAFTENKHWGCRGPLVIDARMKPHHAPVLEKDPVVEKSIDHIFNKGGSLYNKL